MNKTAFQKIFIAFLLSTLFAFASLMFTSCGKKGKTELLSDYVELSANTFVYSGQEIKPQVQVKHKDKTFVQGEDFVAIYRNNTNAGQAKVIISALDSSKNLKGRIEKTFTIQKRPVDDVDITVSNLVFSGNPNVLPQISLKIGEKEFDKSNFNFQINGGYPNTSNSITITAKQNSNFSGSTTKAFVVDYMSLSDALINIDDAAFDGTAKTPNITLKMGDFVFPNEVYEHLLVEYSNNTNVGQARVNISVKDENIFFAINEQKESFFNILPANINQNSQIATINDCQYDGQTEYKISPQVSAFGNALIENVDYDVLYFRDGYQISQNSDFVNGGYITVRIVGKQNFVGTKEITYFIKGIDISQGEKLSINIDDNHLVFNGYTQSPQIAITFDGEPIYSYEKRFSNNVNAGVNTAIATITFFGNYAGTVQKTYSIQPKPINDFFFELTQNEVLYSPDGATVSCILKEFENSQELLLYSDFTLVYLNNQNVSNNATVYATGINNYCGQTESHAFSVIAREITQDMISLNNTTLYYDGTTKTPEISIQIDGQNVLNGNYNISYYQDEEMQIPATDLISAEQTIYIKIAGTNNLVGEIGSFVYTIEKGNMSSANIVVNLSENEFLFDNTAKTPSVSSVMIGDNVLNSLNYSVTYERNVEAGNAYIILTGQENMQGVAIKTFQILPRNLIDATITFQDDLTYDGQNKNIAPTVEGEYLTVNDYDVTYYRVENGEKTPLSGGEVINLCTAGIYEINVIGKQNFSGIVVGTTKINKIENAVTYELKINNWEYGKTEEIPVMQASFGTPLYYYSPFDSNNFSNIIPTQIGHYVCKGQIMESANYFGITQTCDFYITKRNISDAEIFLKEITLDGTNIVSIDYDVLVGEQVLSSDDYTGVESILDNTLVITITAKNSSQFVYGEKEWETQIKQTNNPQIVCEDSYSFGDLVEINHNVFGQTAELKLYRQTNVGYILVQNNKVLSAGSYVAILKTTQNDTNFAQIVKKEFVVTPKACNQNFGFYGFEDIEYNGEDVSKNFVIYDDSQNTLFEGINYTLTIVGDTINANNAGVQVTITFIGNYSGEVIKNFTIAKKRISDGQIVYAPYTGEAFGDNITIRGYYEDEVLYYSNSARTTLATNEQKTNVGTIYGLIRSTRPNVLQDAKFEVHITKAQNEFLQDLLVQNYEYGDVIEKPTINAKFGNAVIKFATYNKYTHTFGEFMEWTNEQKPTSFGTYALKAEVLETQNYYEIHTNTILFKISPQELKRENITVTPLEFTYQADTPQVPTVTVLDKFGNVLTEGNANDYKMRIFKQNGDQKVLVQQANVNVIDIGTYIISIGGRQNYQTTSDIEITFEII